MFSRAVFLAWIISASSTAARPYRQVAISTVRPDGLGPYLEAPPVNPLNGYAGIGLTRKAPSPGDVLRAERLGFLFVTTLRSRSWRSEASLLCTRRPPPTRL